MFSLTSSSIDREIQIMQLRNDKAGALCVFEGWVRDHNQGKRVSSLEYQVYEELALKEGEKIIQEAREKFNLHDIRCIHRFGHLRLGETAVWVGAIASHRDDAFKASRFVIDEIKLRLPIWKKEHYVEHEAKWVFCRDHHTHVHFHEEDYYQKQSKLTQQEKLKNSRVLVVGAGGLGCTILTNLATAGVGHIEVVDFDKIEISNIHRQPLYSPDVVGEKKANIAQVKLQALNPFIKVKAIDQRLNGKNVEELIKGMDLIIDGTDNLETKFLLHDACFKQRLPLISASIYQFEGQIRTFVPGSSHGCLRCTHEHTPEDSQIGNCNDFGILGAAVSTLASIQASEALFFLQNHKNNTIATTYYMDLRTLSQMKIKNVKKEDCRTCAGLVELKASPFEVLSSELLSMEAVLVDLREEDDQILERYTKISKPVVVYCHRGIRSKRLVQEMHQKGHTHFYSLSGGACSL